MEFDRAPFGIVGLETAVPIVFDRLVHPGRITLRRMIELLSVNPARILGVPGGTLAEGAPADVTMLAPDQQVVDQRGGAAVAVEEHPLRRVAAARRRRGDDRRGRHRLQGG